MGFFSSIGNFFQDAAEDVLTIVGEVAGVAAPVVGGFFLGPEGASLGDKLATTFNQVVDRVFEEPVAVAPSVTPVTQQPSIGPQQQQFQQAAATVAPGGFFGANMTPILLIGGAAVVALLVLRR